jgi:hypothetical protein
MRNTFPIHTSIHSDSLIIVPTSFLLYLCQHDIVVTGSSEGHTAYLYKCTHKVKAQPPIKGRGSAASSFSSSTSCSSTSSTSSSSDDIVQISDPVFREAFQVLSANRGAGLSKWVDAKMMSDPRMSGKSASPYTRGQATEDEENKC